MSHATQDARRGRFVTMEGIDGAGKSTHIDTLAHWVRARGHEVVVTREPGGTALAEELRGLVLHQTMDPLTETLLVFAARRDHLLTLIRPALERGATVICDRFTDATFAYQGGGRGFDRAVLGDLERWVQDGMQPDLTLWFDLSPALAAQRRAGGHTPDRFEQLGDDFFERANAVYGERAAQWPERFSRIDAAGTRQEVWAQVEKVMFERGWW